MRRFAYLHGFGSSPTSKKGTSLAASFARRGATLHLPDVNRPSFARLSPARALEAVDELDAAHGDAAAGAKWCFIGSSMGGWLAARWAELHPERVERLALLCPGFELAARWPAIVGQAGMDRWKRDGFFSFPDAEGRMVPVHYAFFEEGSKQPPRPRVQCGTLILHGVRDEVVPIETSRSYAAETPGVTLVELDDVHALVDSLPRVEREIAQFFAL